MLAPPLRLPIALHPLIREAKRRAKRRHLLVATAAILIAAPAAGWFALRPSPVRAVFCAQPPTGWHVRNVHHFGRTDLVLTNFQFGNPADNDGLLDARLAWAPHGVMIAALPWKARPVKRTKILRRLHVRGSQFVFSPGAPHWITSRLGRYEERDMLLWVEVRDLTPDTLAAANRGLAAVRECSV
ncbi:MAG TPA: hypothetical protein VGK69_05940 [Gaiellaceae bacterium]